MAGYFTSATAYVEISDSAALDLIAADGWTFSFFLYPVSTDTQTSFGYIYSHEEPLNFQPAINIIRIGSGIDYGKVRVILDWAGGNLFDSIATPALVDDQWNTLVVSYDGTNLRVHVNGVTDTATPPALPDIQPASVARIGNANISPIGSRWFPGRIAHAAQWSRAFSNSDGQAWSGTFFSPEFAQNALDWHIAMFSGAAWDMQSIVTTATAGGMQWGRHAPVVMPFSQMQGRGVGLPPPINRVFAYYRAA